AGPEALRPREVHQQQQREVALLHELLDEGHAHARRHVPVDVADVVPGRVFAHLGELHPAPLEDRVVGAHDAGLQDGPGPDPDPADALEGLAIHDAWGRAGTPTGPRRAPGPGPRSSRW